MGEKIPAIGGWLSRAAKNRRLAMRQRVSLLSAG
jgi:hypothetical protein